MHSKMPTTADILDKYFNVQETLNERGSRYGDFADNANISQQLQRVMQDAPSFSRAPPVTNPHGTHYEHKGNAVDMASKDLEPDWTTPCEVCGAFPTVPLTGMCGPCTFGEADTAGGNWRREIARLRGTIRRRLRSAS